MTGTINSIVAKALTAATLCSSIALAQNHSDTQHLYPEKTQANWMVQDSETYTASSSAYDLYELSDVFGGDQTAILNQLGAPKQRYEWQTENRHEDGVMDTVVTLVYEGLTIELLELKHKTLVSRVFIENCRLNSLFQNYLCQPLSDVISRLGDPTIMQDDEVIYTLQHGDIGSNPLRLGIKDDKIAWIYINKLID